MWQFFLEPCDVLLFRDGKPFSAGEDHRAKSLFPPTPFTMQGVVRSKVLFDSGVSLYEYAHGAPSAQTLIQQIGTPSGNYGQLRLCGPFVAKRNGNNFIRYFPLPADVVKVNDNYMLVKPLSDHPFSSNQPTDLRPLWARTDKPLKEARGWLAEDAFRRYLQGQSLSKDDVTNESDLIVREPRFGIALDYARRSTQEGMLYTMEFLRFREDVGFLIEVEGIPLFQPEKGFLQVGGEARAAIYEVLQTPLPSISSPNPLPNQFKVVLLTPAWFTDGWQPQGGNWKQFFNGDVTLISAALPRTQSIGGAYADDQQRMGNFQKTMRRFVPAGSVFFFESDGAVTRIGKPFTETPNGEGDFGQIGFGCAVITGWDYA